MDEKFENISIYELSRAWFNWCYENPEMISTNHVALYFFIVEHCNRLGWKYKFGLPSGMAKEAIGIRNYKTYIKTFNDLVKWDFIKLLEKSKNQYSSNIICLSLAHVKNTKATTKALTKASLKHLAKQVQSIDTIIIPDNLIPNNQIPNTENFDFSFENFNSAILEKFKKWIQYRQEIDKPFVSQLQIESEYENLMSLAKNSAQNANAIINRSIGSGWQSLQALSPSGEKEEENLTPHIYPKPF